MNIAVIGTGYVGLVTGACFAETGNKVICIDVDEEKVDRLRKGDIPFYEPGLPEIVNRNVTEGRMSFSTNTGEAVSKAQICFICVGTPSENDGSADLSYVLKAAEEIAKGAHEATIIALKSTVPVGTADQVLELLRSKGKNNIAVVSNPEFLREGTALQDCLQPDRIVVGTDDETIAEIFRELYHPFVRTGKPIFILDHRSAEMAKYAANALLAMRISFVNEISMLCEKVGADIAKVRVAIGADQRIGMQYLFPSIGFGGSCFPKDVRALESLARKNGENGSLLSAILEVNEAQKKNFMRKIFHHFKGKSELQGKRMAIWGLSFKAKTDDIRESPALFVIDELLGAGMNISVYDPSAMQNVEAIYKNRVSYAKFSYAALDGADALCVLTEWNQFRHPDFLQIKELLQTPTIFDGRNLYDPEAMKKLGFNYYSVGRSPVLLNKNT